MPAGPARKARRAQEGKTVAPERYTGTSVAPSEQQAEDTLPASGRVAAGTTASNFGSTSDETASSGEKAAAKPLKKKAIRAMLAKGIVTPESHASTSALLEQTVEGQTAGVTQAGKRKRRRSEEGAENVEEADEKGKAKEEGKAGESETRRYIVFVGNMSFASTTAAISSHFKTHCGEEPKVRLLTTKHDPLAAQKLSKSKQKSISKGKASDPGASRSKGCAFVEFESTKALQKALQFHHTLFEGRLINVELTAGGGGAGSTREEKIKAKNEALEKERQKLHEKYIAPKSESKKTVGTSTQTATEPAAKRSKPLPSSGPGEGAAQWGSRGSSGPSEERQRRGGRRGKSAHGASPGDKDKSKGGARGTGKPPRWAVTGANALKLQG